MSCNVGSPGREAAWGLYGARPGISLCACAQAVERLAKSPGIKEGRGGRPPRARKGTNCGGWRDRPLHSQRFVPRCEKSAKWPVESRTARHDLRCSAVMGMAGQIDEAGTGAPPSGGSALLAVAALPATGALSLARRAARRPGAPSPGPRVRPRPRRSTRCSSPGRPNSSSDQVLGSPLVERTTRAARWRGRWSRRLSRDMVRYAVLERVAEAILTGEALEAVLDRAEAAERAAPDRGPCARRRNRRADRRARSRRARARARGRGRAGRARQRSG